MPIHFALKTADPHFDPRQPVTVNGYLYVPAEPVALPALPSTHPIDRPRGKTFIEVQRRRAVRNIKSNAGGANALAPSPQHIAGCGAGEGATAGQPQSRHPLGSEEE